MANFLTLPDWYSIRRQYVGTPTADFAEVAARLGSIVSVNRDGETWFVEEWESGKRSWVTEDAFGDGDSFITTEKRFSSPFTLKLENLSTTGARIAVSKRLPLPPGETIGLACYFGGGFGIDMLDVDIEVHNGTLKTLGRLRVDTGAHEVQYLNATGGHDVIDTVANIFFVEDVLHILKIVIDFNEHQYVRAIVDGNRYDLWPNGIMQLQASSLEYIEIRIRVWGETGSFFEGFMDSAWVTMNEV